MQFVPHDPEEFFEPNMRRIMAFHEAGHALLAFFHGYQINGFTCWYNGRDWWGSFKNRRIADPPIVDTLPNLTHECQKLLAGELSARIRAGIATDELVLPLIEPAPHRITEKTRFESLILPADERYDGVKVLRRFEANRGHIPDNWWQWICGRHEEARQILANHWQSVESIANRFQSVDPNERDPRHGNPVGRVNGDVVIQWCRDADAPVHDPNVTSIAY